MKKFIALGLVAVGALLLSGCSLYGASNNTAAPVAVPKKIETPATTPKTTTAPAPTPTEKSTTQATQSSITIQNFAFSPANLTIKAGTTVTWTNNDSAPHSIKSSSFTSSSNLATGQTYQFQFNTPGTFNYSCGIHPMMVGTIIVQ